MTCSKCRNTGIINVGSKSLCDCPSGRLVPDRYEALMAQKSEWNKLADECIQQLSIDVTLLEGWIETTKQGGWSTYFVEAMSTRATRLRARIESLKSHQRRLSE